LTSSPPGSARVIWILARTALRRWASRARGQMRWGRKRAAGQPGQRAATPRKSRGGSLIFPFLGAIFLLNGFTLSAAFLSRLIAELAPAAAPPGVILVPPGAYRLITDAERNLAWIHLNAPAQHESPGETEARKEKRIEELEVALRVPYLHGTRRPEERKAKAQEWVRVFKERGSSAFQPGRNPTYGFEVKREWPPPGQEAVLVQAVGLLLLGLTVCLFFMGLGMANQDLGAVSWHLEWLFTLPVPARVLFLARIFEYTLVNAMGWLMTLPFLITLFWAAGYGGWSIPLGLGAGAALLWLVASARMLAETWLRKRFSLPALKNAQAVSTILSLLLFGSIMWVAFTPQVPEAYLKLSRSLPSWALWNPASLPALLCEGGATAAVAGAGLALSALLFGWGATRAAERLVRDGLLVSAGAYRGKRRPASTLSKGRSWFPQAMVGKELRLVLRDRNILVQTLVVPIFMVGIQLVLNPGLLRGASGDIRHAATLAFAVGAYVLVFSGFQVLATEGGALWILYTLPQELQAILFRKTFLWCALAFVYAALTLAGIVLMGPLPGPAALGTALLALVGVVLHGFIASGLGILGTDPLETEVSRKANPVMIYLYLFIAALYANTIYTPSVWNKIAQLVLSSVLAFALWQKVRDRLPYLLDPTEAPPPRIALSDGLVTALAFFVLQTVLVVLFLAWGDPPGASLFYSFTIAGGLAAAFSLYVFFRMKVPRIREAVGLSFPPGSAGKSLGLGVAAGLAAAGFGALYLMLADRWEPLRKLKLEALEMRAGLSADSLLWLGFLAVVAAPLFEEFIFRGLIYRGMRRSAGPLSAMLLSAALFAIVHPPIAVIPVFVLGLATAFIAERTGNLLAPVLAHSIYNLAMVAAN
jgi:ABC-2 type transport system permease protein